MTMYMILMLQSLPMSASEMTAESLQYVNYEIQD